MLELLVCLCLILLVAALAWFLRWKGLVCGVVTILLFFFGLFVWVWHDFSARHFSDNVVRAQQEEGFLLIIFAGLVVAAISILCGLVVIGVKNATTRAQPRSSKDID